MDAVKHSALEPERIRGELTDILTELVTEQDATLLVISHGGKLSVKQVERQGRCFAVLAFVGKFVTA